MKLWGVIFAWLCTAQAILAQDATLCGFVTEAQSGALAPCTVEITDSNGRLVLENDSFRAGFRCSGVFTKQLPPGHTRIRVTHGFETQRAEKELDLVEGHSSEVRFVLHRTVDLRSKGWYAGDSHVHMLHGERTLPVSFEFVAETARAEDLQYLSLAQAWQIQNPAPEFLAAELDSRSRTNCLLTWNLEAPKNYYQGDAGRCLGHCWNMGMRGRTREGADVIEVLLAASAWDYESAKPTFANFESHSLIHEQAGVVFYTHPARWWMGAWGGQGGYPKKDRMRISNMAVELPLDTVLGPTFDGLDLITGPGEFEANDKAFRIWSMLLDHGYRLAATGSSDACFDRSGGAVPGIPRTYSYVPQGFSLQKVTRATAAGHTFVTTGPLLLATVDARPPGSEFKTGQGDHVLAIEAWASGEDPRGLARLQVLRNGQLFRQWEWPDNPGFVRTNFTFREQERCWYCVRVWGCDATKQRAITGAFYFGSYQPPEPVIAQVHARLVDARSGARLKGSLTELSYSGTLPRVGKRHGLQDGEANLRIPGTRRLRAEAAGYRSLVLSPVLDNPQLMTQITGLSDSDLLEWATYERTRREFSNIELEFRLEAQ